MAVTEWVNIIDPNCLGAQIAKGVGFPTSPEIKEAHYGLGGRLEDVSNGIARLACESQDCIAVCEIRVQGLLSVATSRSAFYELVETCVQLPNGNQS